MSRRRRPPQPYPLAISVPIPGPASTQPPPYVEAEATEFEDMPTPVERRCPGCTGAQLVLPDDAQPPDSYGDAWHNKRGGGRCRGTNAWWWCSAPAKVDVEGRLEIPGQGLMATFRDRRVKTVPVIVDQRRPPRR